MTETELHFLSADNKIAATLCLPDGAGPFPVVLMVHGSGPLDRDENIPGQRLDVFNTIAAALSRIGVASVRYDKRGCRRSEGNYYAAGYKDFVEDATALVVAIRSFSWCNAQGVFLLGHSEGCLTAPQVSRRCRVAGLLLLSPVFTDVEELIRRQAERVRMDAAALRGFRGLFYRALLATSPATHSRLIVRVKASTTDTIRFRFRKLEAKSLRQLLALDVRALMSSVSCPMLLIGGGKDIQCDPDDVERIAKAAKQAQVETHVLPNLSHTLRLEPQAPSLFRYTELLKHPIEQRVLELITSWMQRQLAMSANEAQPAVPGDGLASLGRA